MDKKNARIAIYALAGVYLLANAYQMFQNIENSASSGERTLTIAFIIIFAIVGSIMVGVGIWSGNKGMKRYKEEYYSVPKEATDVEEYGQANHEIEDVKESKNLEEKEVDKSLEN